MISIQIGLGYLIIHLLCVMYIYGLFNSQNYVADEIENILVWLFAPEFIIMICIIMYMKERNNK